MSTTTFASSKTAAPATITPRECQDRLSRGEPLELIDVRTVPEYEAVHADGARVVLLEALAASVGASAGPPIALLCKSGGRATRGQAALRAAGCNREVLVVEGGTDAWAAAGLPCVRGTSRVWSLERQVRVAAGALVAVGTALGVLVSPWFLILPAIVGCGLVFAGVTDTCGMAMLLARMPWNRR